MRAKHLSLILAPLLAYCVPADLIPPQKSAVPEAKEKTEEPAPVVSRETSKEAPKACPATARDWHTRNLPFELHGMNNPALSWDDIVMGSFPNTSANGGSFTLDLSALKTGHYMTIPYDSNHSCYYEANLKPDGLELVTFFGCNDPMLLPNFAECGYCPHQELDYSLHNSITYKIEKSCDSLKLTSPETHKTMEFFESAEAGLN